MSRGRRLDGVDVARGLALVAMAAYHFTWDLAFFGVVAPTTPFTPPMRAASHVIGSAFLALAGVSLALAHAHGFRVRAFALRLLKIGAAAALVSAASYAVAPETPIFFGILHCLCVASLLAVPFLIAPGARAAGAALACGVALVAAPFAYASPVFDSAGLIWLGLGQSEPATLDWRPLAPWGGVLLIGLGLARLAPALRDWPARARPLRGLALAGRHSLAVYLIHQPILLALLYGALQVSGFSQRLAVEAYDKACRPACVEAGGEIEPCDRACACVVRDAASAGLAAKLASRAISQAERERIAGIVDACGTQARKN